MSDNEWSLRKLSAMPYQVWTEFAGLPAKTLVEVSNIYDDVRTARVDSLWWGYDEYNPEGVIVRARVVGEDASVKTPEEQLDLAIEKYVDNASIAILREDLKKALGYIVKGAPYHVILANGAYFLQAYDSDDALKIASGIPGASVLRMKT